MTKWYVWADLFWGIWENGAAVRSFGSNILIMDCMSLALTHSHGRTAASVSFVQSNFAPCYMHIKVMKFGCLIHVIAYFIGF